MSSKEIFDIFNMGIDYGQLMMEEERDSEDWSDAFQGHLIDKKYSMPSQQSPRRQPHSEKWREAKRKSYRDFVELLANTAKAE